jgi:hypothetical protein
MDIKPIETKYKGYRFRSRLEARWAVFFDGIGLDWKYEIQGFIFDGRKYLPDFCVNDKEHNKLWVEIKPDYPSEDIVAKLEIFCKRKNESLIIFSSDPYDYFVNCNKQAILINDKSTIISPLNILTILLKKVKDEYNFNDFLILENCIKKFYNSSIIAREKHFEWEESEQN